MTCLVYSWSGTLFIECLLYSKEMNKTDRRHISKSTGSFQCFQKNSVGNEEQGKGLCEWALKEQKAALQRLEEDKTTPGWRNAKDCGGAVRPHRSPSPSSPPACSAPSHGLSGLTGTWIDHFCNPPCCPMKTSVPFTCIHALWSSARTSLMVRNHCLFPAPSNLLH